MKIEITDKNEKPFPKLMVNTNKHGKTIILAHGCDEKDFYGTCIYTTHSENKVSEVSSNWYDFKDFEGSITLSND